MANEITVIIPVKNEAQNLRDCVQSARLVGDEILVADSGSTDNTKQIATELGCRLIERELINFGDFKNWAIPQARHRWVFVLDADERIPEELANEIRKVVAEANVVKGFWVRRANHFMGHPVRFGGWGRDRVIRLFLRDEGRYSEYTDHTEVQLSADALRQLRHKLIHYTCWDYDSIIRKMDRYTNQQAEQWMAAGKRPRTHKLIINGPLRFFRDYIVHAGFLDGKVGFQIAMITGFYSFLKQARFWQKYHGHDEPQVTPTNKTAA